MALADSDTAGPMWRQRPVLFISHAWDPATGGAEALAGRRLVTALRDAGAAVEVVAAGDGTESERGTTAVPEPRCPEAKLRRAWQMVRTTVPEAEGTWVAAAVRAGERRLAEMPAETTIYSRSMPGSSNVAGWHLARRSGRPWVAHFSDPWPPRQVLARGRAWLAPYKPPLYAFWRRRILRDAGAITAPSAALLAGLLPPASLPGRGFVVSHLASEAAPAVEPAAFEFFHIVHAGNFYPLAHTASGLLQGLQRFLERTPEARRQTRLTQAGWEDGDLPEWTTRCRLGDVVHRRGPVAQAEMLTLIRSASLLVAIDYARRDSTVVLSKLPDYINAHRPILTIAASTSAMGGVVTGAGVGLLADYDSVDQIASAIARVFAAWQRRSLQALLPADPARLMFARGTVLTELARAFAAAQARRLDGGRDR
jgi:hypothetical protein